MAAQKEIQSQSMKKRLVQLVSAQKECIKKCLNNEQNMTEQLKLLREREVDFREASTKGELFIDSAKRREKQLCTELEHEQAVSVEVRAELVDLRTRLDDALLSKNAALQACRNEAEAKANTIVDKLQALMQRYRENQTELQSEAKVRLHGCM